MCLFAMSRATESIFTTIVGVKCFLFFFLLALYTQAKTRKQLLTNFGGRSAPPPHHAMAESFLKLEESSSLSVSYQSEIE